MKSSTKTLMVMALVMFSFASVMHATSINCALTPSASACAPTLTMSYQVGNGQVQDVAVDAPVFSSGMWSVSIAPQGNAGAVFVSGFVATNSDPFVGFSGVQAINNTGSTVTFSFDYKTPYSGGPYALVRTIYGDVLINTAFTGTAKITPVGGGGFIMNTYDTGTLIPSMGIGKGCTASFVCFSPDSGAIGPLAYTSLASGILEVKGSFSLTKHSQATLTGRSDLLPAPEPGTLALLGSGLVGLAGFARRRMSN